MNGLKTIYSRITTMGPAQDALEAIGVHINTIGENGERVIKPVGDILGEVADRWYDLTDSQRQNLGVTLAGRFQLSRFLALMNNWHIATDATATALRSEGSAMKENQEYMKSFEARINKLKNSFTEMALAIGDAFLTDAMLGVIDILADMAKMAIGLAENVGALPVVFGALTLGAGGMGMFKKNSQDTTQVVKNLAGAFMLARRDGVSFKDALHTVDGGLDKVDRTSTRVKGGIGRLAGSFANLAFSLGAGLLMAGIGMIIESFVKKAREAKELREQIEENNNKLIDSYRNTTGGLESLVSEHKTLQDQVNNGTITEGTEAYNEYLAVNEELARQMPAMVEYIDAKGQSHLRSADAIAKELELAEELSSVEAEYQVKAFKGDVRSRAEDFVDLGKKIGKATKKLKEYNELNGKMPTIDPNSGFASGDIYDRALKMRKDVGYEQTEHNFDKEIREQEMILINFQREIQNATQETLLQINQASLAALEADKVLANLSDAQKSSVEKLAKNNEKYLLDISMELMEIDRTQSKKQIEKLEEEIIDRFVQASDEMREASVAIGHAINDKQIELLKGVTNTDEIERIKIDFDHVINSLPETFYTKDMINNVDVFRNGLDEVVSVAEKIRKGEGTFDSLVKELEDVAGGSESAEVMVAVLGHQYKNSAIRAEALEKAQEGVNEELQDFVETAMEAIDVGATLFGHDQSNVQGVISHLELLKSMVDLGIENDKIWQDSIYDLSFYFNESAEFIEKNIDGLHRLMTSMNEWQPEFDENGKLTDEARELFEKIQKEADKIGIELAIDVDGNSIVVAEDALEGIEDGAVNATGALHEFVEYMPEVEQGLAKTKESIEEEQTAVERLTEAYQGYIDGTSGITKAEYFNIVKEEIDNVTGSIEVTKDSLGNLKLTMADGSSNEYLNVLNEQILDSNGALVLVDDELGNLKLAFEDSTGSYFLAEIPTQAEGAVGAIGDYHIALDDTIEKQDFMRNQKVFPEDYDQINFKELWDGMDGSIDRVQFLAEALRGVWEDLQVLAKIEGALDIVKAKTDEVVYHIKGMFDSSRADLDTLIKKADETRASVKKLTDEFANLNKKASEISLKELENLKTDLDNAIISLKDFSVELGNNITVMNLVKEQTKKATGEINKEVDKQIDKIKDLGDEYEDTKDDIVKSFIQMKNTVVRNSDTMIKKHDSQKKAVSDLATSAKNARKTIQDLNSSASNAMKGLDNYISKANKARSAGSNLPTPTVGRSVGAGIGGGNRFAMSGIASEVATLSMSAGESSGGEMGSGDSGTSGILNRSFYEGGVNLEGVYNFQTLASSTKDRADLFTWNKQERLAQSYESSISLLELKMNNLTSTTLKYRNALNQIITQQNKLVAVNKKDLTQTEKRQKTIEKQIKNLGATSKHTVKQRDQYNKLQQEYEQNISKISSLKNSIESVSQNIRNKSLEIFTDFIDEIARKYDEAMATVQRKTENIQFKLNVLELTNPDDLKSQLNLLAQKASSLQNEQARAGNQEDTMLSEYNKAVKKYGKTSAQAKKVKEELDKSTKAWEDITIKVLQAEKEIFDVRAKVADAGISELKKYYGNMRDMAIKAIDLEQNSLKKAHEERIKMYDEEAKKVSDVYDEKLKSMDKEKSELSYIEELDIKTSQRAELLRLKAILARDDSLEGKKKLSELEAEIKEADVDLIKFQKERHEDLLRQSLEDQKQANLEAIEAKRESEETEHERQIERLELEKEEVTKKYNDLIENDRKWAEMRDEFIKGNFSTLQNELSAMEKVLNDMGNGIYDGLTASFSGFSDEVKKQVKEMNALLVDSMKLSASAVVKDVKDTATAKKPTITAGKPTTSTTKPKPVTPPKVTTKPKAPAPAPKPTPAPPKKTGVSALPLTKKKYAVPKGGWDKHSVVD